jgi:pumilio RNA-binding family
LTLAHLDLPFYVFYVSGHLMAGRQFGLQKSTFFSGNSSMKGLPTPTLGGGGGLPAQYKHLDGINSSIPNYGLSGFFINPALASMIAQQLGTGNLPPLFENVAAASSAMAIPGMDS